MIRAILVAKILVSFPEHTIPCWAVKRAVVRYGEATVGILGVSQGLFRQGDQAGKAMPQAASALTLWFRLYRIEMGC
jgi:hypothetical protein